MKVIFLFLAVTFPGQPPVESRSPQPSIEVCLKEAGARLAGVPDRVGAYQASCIVVVPPTIDN